MYSASKAAADVSNPHEEQYDPTDTEIKKHLARNLAVELGPRNITSNSIAPGFFPSKLAQGLISNLGGEESLSHDNPLGRLGEPEDVGGVATFLCSPAGRYV